MSQRRQRYFRARSPNEPPADMVDIIDQEHDELAMETGVDQMDDYQRHQVRFAVSAPNPPRRPGRPAKGFQMDMVAKLQNKGMYRYETSQQQPQQHGIQQQRIAPNGARIVTLASGQAHNSLQQRNELKRPAISAGMNNLSAAIKKPKVPLPAPQGLKVVRLVANSMRQPQEAISEVDERIKDVLQGGKIDLHKIKSDAQQQMTPEEYHGMLGAVLSELERATNVNNQLTDFYKQRLRHEKTLAETREAELNARIRTLEADNRKLRESIVANFQARYDSCLIEQAVDVDQDQLDEQHVEQQHIQQHHLDEQHHIDQQHEHEMGQIMEGEPEDEHDVKEGHIVVEEGQEEGGPEWIVEETVDDGQVHEEVEGEQNVVHEGEEVIVGTEHVNGNEENIVEQEYMH